MMKQEAVEVVGKKWKEVVVVLKQSTFQQENDRTDWCDCEQRGKREESSYPIDLDKKNMEDWITTDRPRAYQTGPARGVVVF